MTASRVFSVIGASGGVGATTLAAALTRRLAIRLGQAVLLDLDVGGGGAEVTTAVEHREGVRWLDLRDVVGPVDGQRLAEALPGLERAGVLSAGGRGPLPRAEIPSGACQDVLASLIDAGVPTVVDLPRFSPLLAEVCRLPGAVALVSSLHTRALADLDALVERLESSWSGATPQSAGLVTRGRRVPAEVIEAIERHLGLPHLVHVADDRRVPLACERGEWPGSARDGLRSVADVLLDRWPGASIDGLAPAAASRAAS